MQNKTHYEITTIKIDKGGNKMYERVEKIKDKPEECRDLKNSMKLLKAIKDVDSACPYNDNTFIKSRNGNIEFSNSTDDSRSL